MSESLALRERIRSGNLFFEAVAQSDLPFRQKLMLRMAYRAPGIRDDIDQFVVDGIKAQGDVGTMAPGDFLKFIIDNLPQIIALIEMLMKLFA